jgi:beta-phosphoglucomutase-like phosphatase (HAD superfamily)
MLNELNRIEEMANDIAKICPDLVDSGCLDKYCYACITEALLAQGYRKSTDVAMEIFAEIEQEIISALGSNYRAKAKISARGEENCITYHIIEGKIATLRGIVDFIEELRKKYESEGAE